jgi:hypothetical protein
MDSAVRELIQGVAEGLDPAIRFARVVGDPDDWQIDFLRSADEFVVCLCSRQVGKSTATACLAWDTLTRGKFVLLVAPSERQAKELFRKVIDFKNADRTAPTAIRSTLTELELANGGRLVCAPSSSDTIRGYSVDSLILEEAAFQPDDLITAVLPMRKADGRVIMISTPAGRSGLFYDLWTEGKVRKVYARSIDITRLAEKVDFDRRHMPSTKFRQEHLCEFLGSGVPFFDPLAIEAAINNNAKALVL